ncbi:MAG: ATP-dependent DNA helicase [Methanomassiliicoccales archaeon]|nr:MAG: ATP-dependent DNA helicase [Methanomassiliicoccales archaeon]
MVDSLFPYELRKKQSEIMTIIADSVEGKSHLVMESGTGSGKTICTLVPTLGYALKQDKRVLYLTRTNSQQRQVIYELRKINAKEKIFGLGIQGRHQMCPSLKQDSMMAKGSPDELSKICGKRKMEVLKSISEGTKPKSCKYYAKVCIEDTSSIRNWAFETHPTVEEFTKRCEDEGICPYEANKSLVRDAVLVTAPYIYFFNQFIRTRVLEWMGCTESDIILIVDEAHNLPDYARDIESMELGIKTLDMAKSEAREFGDLRTSDGFHIAKLMRRIKDIISVFQKDYLKEEEDAFIPPGEFLGELMHEYNITSRKLKAMASDLIIHGEIIKDVRLKDGVLPRSYIHSVGHFLSFWIEQQNGEFVKLIHNHGKTQLQIYCLEPAIASKAVLECHSSIHMSGTLTPLEEYRDSVGLPSDSILASFPSPFPMENRVVIYVEDVTTRYEDLSKDRTLIPKMEDYLLGLSTAFKRNTAIFFPSFRIMKLFLADGLYFGINKRFYVEEQGMNQREIMDLVEGFKSRSQEGAVLLSVVGGRLSEGIDYPSEQMEILVIVGIPYPKPSAKQKAQEIFYDRKFKKGWEYAVKAPTTRRLLQTIGRLIRDEKDRGVAVILDKRASHFKEFLPDLKLSPDVIKECRDFFKNG